MLRLGFAGMMALSLASASTAASTKECLSEAEGSAVFAAMLPDLIDGLRDKCGTYLSAGSFLAKNADGLIERYRTVADQRWPTAKLAFARIAGEEEMVDKLPDEFFRPMIGVMIGKEVLKDLKVTDCPSADRIVENLAPLPAENVAGLIGAILMLAEEEKDQNDNLPMCRA
jgi:hypothetical protein